MNKQKAVAGMHRGQCAFSAASRALADGKAPSYVDHWIEWFDKTPCEHLPVKSNDLCGKCQDKNKCEAA